MAKKRSYPILETTRLLEKTLTRYYLKSKYHHLWGKPLRRPLAWVTSGAPVELLLAMGVHPVYPEQYGALCTTRRASGELCQAAEAAGFSQDLCSYARSHLGSILQPEKAPLKGLPRPDLLVCCNNICGTVLKWYEALSRHFQAPLLFLDTPFLPGELTPPAHEYVQEQLREMISFLKQLTGRRFDPEELRRRLQLSDQAVGLWKEIRELCRNRPSPLNGTDLFIHMAPIVVLRGTQGAVDYYLHLRDEVRQRVQNGKAAVEGEKIRLVWDNIAIWTRLFGFFKTFTDHQACFVTDTYTGGWAMDIAPGDPVESLASTYTEVFLNRSPEYRARQIIELIRDYSADGFVMHSNRSCKPYSHVQEVIRRRVTRETGVPGLIVEADMADPRAYADEPIRNRVQAYLEALGGI
ncbi:MAG: 2-hydroxyacyl-CoA dehydratase [Firmicutes bacterium]|nr:2-hydroxyacyl-CoA dehydratase [Bacillota bacterium]